MIEITAIAVMEIYTVVCSIAFMIFGINSILESKRMRHLSEVCFFLGKTVGFRYDELFLYHKGKIENITDVDYSSYQMTLGNGTSVPLKKIKIKNILQTPTDIINCRKRHKC